MKGLDLNKSPSLPASSGSTEGATSGSLGDASMADLKKGYHSMNEPTGSGMKGSSLIVDSPPGPQGFLTRPGGWER